MDTAFGVRLWMIAVGLMIGKRTRNSIADACESLYFHLIQRLAIDDDFLHFVSRWVMASIRVSLKMERSALQTNLYELEILGTG